MPKRITDKMLQTAIKARKLLSKPERWCKGWYARDKRGLVTYADDSSAVSWCLVGAFRKISPDLSVSNLSAVTEFIVGQKNQIVGIHEYNDHPKRTHKQILAKLDQAIARRKKQLGIAA